MIGVQVGKKQTIEDIKEKGLAIKYFEGTNVTWNVGIGLIRKVTYLKAWD